MAEESKKEGSQWVFGVTSIETFVFLDLIEGMFNGGLFVVAYSKTRHFLELVGRGALLPGQNESF